MSAMSWTGAGRAGAGGPETGGQPGVDAAVRMLRRRRGWAWTGGGAVAALVVFTVIGSHLWANASGALGAIRPGFGPPTIR